MIADLKLCGDAVFGSKDRNDFARGVVHCFTRTKATIGYQEPRLVQIVDGLSFSYMHVFSCTFI